jgi:hypothetical protein
MCNANNHDESSRCDFWGPGHLGSGGYRGEGNKTDFTLAGEKFFNYSSSISYLYPNTKCPECRCAVYFLKLSNGGRIFFDEIRPPWPKHPCTDINYSNKSDNELFIKDVIIKEDQRKKTIAEFKWSIVVVKRVINERILIGIKNRETSIENNVWIKYEKEIHNIYNNKDVILLIDRDGNKMKLHWVNISEYIIGEKECKIFKN